jgi:hypothetical protein
MEKPILVPTTTYCLQLRRELPQRNVSALVPAFEIAHLPVALLETVL